MIACFAEMPVLLIILCLIYGEPQASALSIDDFFPFGPANGDSQLPGGDDEVSSEPFPGSFQFFGKSYSFFGVSDWSGKLDRNLET